ncbi:hypothetical protein MHU86_15355 [Fragilaria crotonensis]|nr:hypothetical protein MHU86_17654 [Fragilaria crotonensis]KAI2499146.1 hypothetical protein MHU86_15355 [Fragilaria crotonensis]
MTNKNKGKRKASENSSAEHVAFRQSNLALNPPSIYFDRPKKSTEKSDDEGNYKKIDVPIEAGNANSKISKENSFVWRLRHLARSVGEVAHRARGGHS